MQAKRLLLALTLFAIAAWWLAGCQVRPDFGKPKLDPALVQAQTLAQTGDPLGAGVLYQSVAERSSGAERNRLLLQAAGYYLAGGDLDRARRLLVPLDSVQFPPTDALRLRLLHAELLLREERVDEALLRLAAPPAIDVPVDLHRRYHRAMAEAYRQTGQALLRVQALQSLDVLQPDPAERLLIQQDILHTLTQVDEQTLRIQQPPAPDTLGGWMQLALNLQRYQGYPRTLAARLADWRMDYPTHPVLPELLDSYLTGGDVAAAASDHVALLLPESGRYAKAAAAIRDGFLAAWYQDSPSQRPRLEFYDSANPDEIWPVYTQAIEDGARLVVGPLDKTAVAQLVRAGALPRPVLALNQVDSADLPPANLFQFSLSPEDEARQAAEHAWYEGLRSPIVLTPANDWGDRLLQAFNRRWNELGGLMIDQDRYDPNEVDHTKIIRQLMGYREREVEGKRKPQPERREDIDFIFIVAKPEQAQQIRPQLLYFLAGDLPIYATSHAWPGQLTAQQARDMAGIRVPEIPWLVGEDTGDALSQAELSRLLPASATAYAPLYAMGIDAYQLLPHLGRLQSSPLESLQGKTGVLHLNERHHVQRQMIWLRIDKVPQVLGYSPRLAVPGADEPGPSPTPLDPPPGPRTSASRPAP